MTIGGVVAGFVVIIFVSRVAIFVFTVAIFVIE